MNLPRRKANVVIEALKDWENDELISTELKNKLQETIKIVPFDWRRVANYSFVVAIIAFMSSIVAIISDQVLMKIIAAYFKAPAVIKSIFFISLSVCLFYFGFYRKRTKPEMVFQNEAVFSLGVFAYAIGLFYVGQFLELQPETYRILALSACLSYGVLGCFLQSPLIWTFSLLSLGGWLGAETGYLSGWGSYYFGMNYPLRFVLLGSILTGVSLLHYTPRFRILQKTTLSIGLLYLFMSLWILSIFGNYGDVGEWFKVKQIELFHWSLLFGLVAIGSIAHGLKYDNTITRGFGLVFLFINLYTRFFELFWKPLHMAIFFAILGISLWFLGSKAEKIWNFQLANKK